MKFKSMIALPVILLSLAGSLTVCAQPVVMEDGTVFDAAFYAQIYPDVVAVFGTDADALYRHYLAYGKAEGRLAADPAVTLPGTDVAAAGAATEVPAVFDDAHAVWELVNACRIAAGIPALAWEDSLQASASQRAYEASVLFSHTRPDGSSGFTAFPSNLPLQTMGENIAKGQLSPQDAVIDWMNSASHRENILDPGFTKTGVGCYQDASGQIFRVQLFGG